MDLRLIGARACDLPGAPIIEGTKGRSDPVYMGGPVEVQNVLSLLRANTMPEGRLMSRQDYLVSSKLLSEKTLVGTGRPKRVPRLPRILRLGPWATGKRSRPRRLAHLCCRRGSRFSILNLTLCGPG